MKNTSGVVNHHKNTLLLCKKRDKENERSKTGFRFWSEFIILLDHLDSEISHQILNFREHYKNIFDLVVYIDRVPYFHQ